MRDHAGLCFCDKNSAERGSLCFKGRDAPLLCLSPLRLPRSGERRQQSSAVNSKKKQSCAVRSLRRELLPWKVNSNDAPHTNSTAQHSRAERNFNLKCESQMARLGPSLGSLLSPQLGNSSSFPLAIHHQPHRLLLASSPLGHSICATNTTRSITALLSLLLWDISSIREADLHQGLLSSLQPSSFANSNKGALLDLFSIRLSCLFPRLPALFAAAAIHRHPLIPTQIISLSVNCIPPPHDNPRLRTTITTVIDTLSHGCGRDMRGHVDTLLRSRHAQLHSSSA